VQRPIAVTFGTVVVVEEIGTVVVVDEVGTVVVVESLVGMFGIEAPVENRHPDPGGLKAVKLTIGGGRFLDGPGGCVVGVDVVEERTEVVVFDEFVDVVDVVTCNVVVGSAAMERWSSLSWNPTMMRAETQSPSTTRKGQPGRASSRVDSLGI
jgi:hypothetical protein